MKYETKRGDTLPALMVTVGDGSDGFITDPTGATVEFTMTKIEDETKKTDNANGSIQNISQNADNTYKAELVYAWQSADVDTAGEYEGEFKVTIGADTIRIPKKNGELLVTIDNDLSG